MRRNSLLPCVGSRVAAMERTTSTCPRIKGSSSATQSRPRSMQTARRFSAFSAESANADERHPRLTTYSRPAVHHESEEPTNAVKTDGDRSSKIHPSQRLNETDRWPIPIPGSRSDDCPGKCGRCTSRGDRQSSAAPQVSRSDAADDRRHASLHRSADTRDHPHQEIPAPTLCRPTTYVPSLRFPASTNGYRKSTALSANLTRPFLARQRAVVNLAGSNKETRGIGPTW